MIIKSNCKVVYTELLITVSFCDSIKFLMAIATNLFLKILLSSIVALVKVWSKRHQTVK